MKLKYSILLLAFIPGKLLKGQSSTDIIAYINSYKAIAISEMQRTSIPASIILAQGIHETEAGTSELVKKSNNHFGIKCKDSWTGSVVFHDDDERGECFRSYNSAQDSYKDHSNFLMSSTRYSFLFKLDPLDYQAWANGLKKAGYATNPKYPQILVQLIRDYNLQQYSLIAMGKLKPSDEVIAGATNNQNATGSGTPDAGYGMRGTGYGIRELNSSSQQYPQGEFQINNTRVIFAKAGTALLSLSDQYEIPLSRLLDFNDLKEEDILVSDQLIYLQRKRKTGAVEFHIVQNGESLYDICQEEGIRYENLLLLNQLSAGEEPATGEKIYLQTAAARKPALQAEKNIQNNPNIQAPVNIDTKEKTPAAVSPSDTVTHIVQTRETLYSISKKYAVPVEKLQQWNKLYSLDLKEGQELIIYKN